jgi:hypothetical protein
MNIRPWPGDCDLTIAVFPNHRTGRLDPSYEAIARQPVFACAPSPWHWPDCASSGSSTGRAAAPKAGGTGGSSSKQQTNAYAVAVARLQAAAGAASTGAWHVGRSPAYAVRAGPGAAGQVRGS